MEYLPGVRSHDLPNFADPRAALRLTGLDLNVSKINAELSHRGYSPAECLYVVCREVNEVMAIEYGLLSEVAARGLPLQLFTHIAGLRDRATTRCNARFELLFSRLPPVPVLTVDKRVQLPLVDKLLPAVRGYKLLACSLNKLPVNVQIGAGPVKQLSPGAELLLKSTDDPVWVSGEGQTVRWSRVPQNERAGNLKNVLPLPAVVTAAKSKPSLWSRLRRKPK